MGYLFDNKVRVELYNNLVSKLNGTPMVLRYNLYYEGDLLDLFHRVNNYLYNWGFDDVEIAIDEANSRLRIRAEALQIINYMEELYDTRRVQKFTKTKKKIFPFMERRYCSSTGRLLYDSYK